MSNIISSNLLKSSLVAGALLATSVVGVNVSHADTTASNNDTQNSAFTNESNINKSDILTVANHDNESLQQIADNNNVDVSVLENLNDNIDSNKPLPDGTLIYLPQNVVNDTDSFFTSFASVSPYSNVPSNIKRKYYDTLSAANRSAKNWIA